MRRSLRRWLLQRRIPETDLSAWERRKRRCGFRHEWQSDTWEVFKYDPYLDRAMRSNVFTGRETATVTRVIYQGETQAYIWDDTRRTWTMPTMKLAKR